MFQPVCVYISEGVKKYLSNVSKLAYDKKPDYNQLRQLLCSGAQNEWTLGLSEGAKVGKAMPVLKTRAEVYKEHVLLCWQIISTCFQATIVLCSNIFLNISDKNALLCYRVCTTSQFSYSLVTVLCAYITLCLHI